MNQSRIERIQQAHPWMQEQHIIEMLVAKYFLLTRISNLDGDELTAGMEEFVNEIIIKDEDQLRGAIAYAHPEV